MANSNLFITKKVSLVKSLTVDTVTDDVINDITTRAKTEKGQKLKMKINEVGIKLSRVRLLQESHIKVFPIKSVHTIMQVPDFPRCVMVILTDPDKKYKIVALRCDTEADTAKLASTFAEIQNKAHFENVELRKRENGNWTLRGRSDHNSNIVLKEVFKEHTQPNGDLRESQTNGGVATQVPVIVTRESYKKKGHDKNIYIKQKEVPVVRTDKESDSDSDKFVIETEVAADEYVPVKVHDDRQLSEVQDVTTRIEHAPVHAVPTTVWVSGKQHSKHPQTSALPSRPVVYRTTSSNVAHPQNVVYQPTSSHVIPTQHVVHTSTSSHPAPTQHIVYGSTSSGVAPSQQIVYRTTSRNVDSEPIIYTASSSSRPIHPNPDRISVSSRSYQVVSPTVTRAPAGHYTNPWAIRQVSRQSSTLPIRVEGDPAIIRADQQSIISTTSKLSRGSRFRSSEMSIPTTVRRSIEHVYPRQFVVMRPGAGYVVGHRPRPASYHAQELRVYHEHEDDAGILF